jgi:hypothetical protein
MKLNFSKKKLIIVVVIIVLGAAVFFVFRKGPKNISLDVNNAKNSAKSGAAGGVDNQSSGDTNSGQGNPGDGNSAPTEEVTDENGEIPVLKKQDLDPNNNASTGGKEMAHITTEHCRTGCEAFANKLDYFEYCQQVCGITPAKNVSKCDGKDGIEKDYCLKDLGIAKSDTSICDQIEDANVKKTCKNRITEDLIEMQSSQPEPE